MFLLCIKFYFYFIFVFKINVLLHSKANFIDINENILFNVLVILLKFIAGSYLPRFLVSLNFSDEDLVI